MIERNKHIGDCLTLLYSGDVKLSRCRRSENTVVRLYFALNFNF
nr:MAG TPA: hypothetical protein [Bacteriophage sp.]